MKSFLIVYNTRTGTLLSKREFEAGQDDEALHQRFREELSEHEGDDIDIVVLRATSEKAIRESHARYFVSSKELLESAGEVVRPGEKVPA
jgi:hypothetical protein